MVGTRVANADVVKVRALENQFEISMSGGIIPWDIILLIFDTLSVKDERFLDHSETVDFDRLMASVKSACPSEGLVLHGTAGNFSQSVSHEETDF